VPSDIAKPAKPRRGFSIIERAIDRLDSEVGVARGAMPADLPLPPPRQEPPAASALRGATGPAAHASPPAQVALPADRLRARGLLAPGSGRSKLAEQYRLVKRPLINRALGAPAARVTSKLIMVTSAMPEEGKTFTAFNLALSISSEREIQVVLIDADPHRGQILETLGLEPRAGLFDYLAGTVRHLQDVLLPTERDNLWLLPAGTAHGDSSELMMGPRMAQLVTELELAYRPRIVLFDTPPLLASTESTMLASHVGQIVMVVEASRTSRPRLDEALRMVSACPDVNLLLNKAQDISQYEQYGGYKAA
jgi:protein-tyrosine kinase